MKRFFSLALALCLSLSAVTISAQAAPTAAGGLVFKGKPNTALSLTAAAFETKIDSEGQLTQLTVTVLPDSGDGELRIGSDAIEANDPIPWASVSSLVFHPAAGFHSTTDFTWTASDEDGPSSPVTATLDFTVPAPVAQDQTVRVFINTVTHGTLKATDAEGYALSYVKASEPAHGDVLVSSKTGAFTYTPDKDYVGNDSFTFTATNGFTTSNIATVSISVGNVKSPSASPLSFTVDYNGEVTGTLTGFDPNTPALDLDFIKLTDPAKGSITSFNTETGVFTYKHKTTGLVSDTFNFRTTNGYRESETASVTIKINPPAPTPYRDMTTHWAGFSAGILRTLDFAVGEEIQKMYYFNPTKTVTRAEFARFLNSVMGIPLSKNTASHFADVTEPYMIETINALYERGISSGTQVGTNLYFYPNRTLTRIEAMRMVDKAMNFPAPGTADLTFADRHLIPGWAEQSVKNLVNYKIVVGNNGFLRPTATITRAEVAQLMYLAYVEKKK